MEKFDIKDRTFNFGIEIINLIRKFPKDTAGFAISKQLIRSGTSIGANMEEADGASTRKDFFHKVSIAIKEAKETRYWLRLALFSKLISDSDAASILQENEELIKILSSIIKKGS